MRYMEIKHILIALIASLTSCCLYAQNGRDDNKKANGDKELLDLWNLLVTREQDLSLEVDEAKALLLSLRSDLKKREEKSDDKGWSDLQEEFEQSKNEAERLNTEIKQLSQELDGIDEEIVTYASYNEKLKSLRNKTITGFINGSNKTLGQSFAELSADELNRIEKRCGNYDSDERVEKLADKVRKIKDYKDIHDDAVGVLEMRYDKGMVERTIRRLKSIPKDVLSFPQQKDINRLLGGAENYAKGIAVFKKYIDEINRRRDGMDGYTVEYYNYDREKALDTDNLRKDIDRYVRKVPYLDRAFDDHHRTLLNDPASHPEIEKEIEELYTLINGTTD